MFWLHPLSFALLALTILVLLLVSPFRLMINPITLPEFAGPVQEDFWSLQKKLVDVESTASASVKLSHSEFNAFISRFQLSPEGGFCLQRLRCSSGNASATLYIIGSGFFMRSLIFQLDLTTTEPQPKIERVRINGLELTGGNWFAGFVVDYLKKLAMKNSESSLARILQGKGQIEFRGDHVLLHGEFMPVRPKSEAEELPVVEIEESPSEN